jgi:tetratricopeptide (TPR) repeat protein
MRDRCYAAFLFDELEEYQESIAELDALLAEMPHDYVSLNNRGVMHWEVGQAEQAERDLKAACDLAASDALPHENLGRFWKERGERDLAIASYQRALLIAPGRSTARAGLIGLGSKD